MAVGRNFVGIFVAIDFCAFGVMAILMNTYHWWLISRNLTTNEDMNKMRYIWLKDDAGRFSNVFNEARLRRRSPSLPPHPP